MAVASVLVAFTAVTAVAPPNVSYLPLIQSTLPTPTPVPPKSKVIYQDDFSNPASGWPSSDNGQVKNAYDSGAYQILVRPAGWSAVASAGISATNFTVQVDAWLASSSAGQYGIVFNMSPDGKNYYLYDIDYGDNAEIWKVRNGNWTNLAFGAAPSTGSTPQTSHQLTLTEDGSAFSGFVDGQLTILATDSSLAPGMVGLGVLEYANESNVDARFDNFVLSNGLVWSAGPSMPTSRFLLGTAASPDQMVYAIGGLFSIALANNEAYDPSTNSWSTRAPMPTARYSLVTVTWTDGSIYAIGGVDSNGFTDGNVERYDPTTDSWTERAPMPTKRSGMGAAVGPDGLIYVFGGSPSVGSGTALSTVEAYNPATDTWSSRASMPTARLGLAVATGSDGHIYAIGGESLGSNAVLCLATVEMYDPYTDSWTTRASMITPRNTLSAVAASDGYIYAIGGNFVAGGGDSQQYVEAYNPVANIWSSQAPLLSGGEVSAALGTRGTIYVLGATDRNGNEDVLQIGTPGAPGLLVATPMARSFPRSLSGLRE
jgi:N-acetylneuraminic acid mutarotase